MRRTLTTLGVAALLLAPGILAACSSTPTPLETALDDAWSRYGDAKGTNAAARSAPPRPIGLLAEAPGSCTTSGVISDVCIVKGCWMRLRDDAGNEVLVRFADYGFFVPRNARGRTAVVYGNADVQTLSVEARRHLAADAGQSPAEIAAIRTEKSEVTIVAHAVWIQGSGLQPPYAAITQEDCPEVDASVPVGSLEKPPSAGNATP
jgi:hypothetical protein